MDEAEDQEIKQTSPEGWPDHGIQRRRKHFMPPFPQQDDQQAGAGELIVRRKKTAKKKVKLPNLLDLPRGRRGVRSLQEAPLQHVSRVFENKQLLHEKKISVVRERQEVERKLANLLGSEAKIENELNDIVHDMKDMEQEIARLDAEVSRISLLPGARTRTGTVDGKRNQIIRARPEIVEQEQKARDARDRVKAERKDAARDKAQLEARLSAVRDEIKQQDVARSMASRREEELEKKLEKETSEEDWVLQRLEQQIKLVLAQMARVDSNSSDYKSLKRTFDKYMKEREERGKMLQRLRGAGRAPGGGLRTDEINHVMHNYKSKIFRGAIPADGLQFVDWAAPGKTKSWIMNLDPHDKPGYHWVGVYYDGKARKFDYFDSYGKAPPPGILKDFKRMDPEATIHHNRKITQRVDSDVCGWEAMQHVLDREFDLPGELGEEYPKHKHAATEGEKKTYRFFMRPLK